MTYKIGDNYPQEIGDKRNVKCSSSSSHKKKVTTDGNIQLHKRIKSTGNKHGSENMLCLTY